jgi:hypothetical protein
MPGPPGRSTVHSFAFSAKKKGILDTIKNPFLTILVGDTGFEPVTSTV